MRHAPLTGDLRNIRPQNYRKKGTNSWTRSWQVHFTFKHRDPVSESFNWNRYGGEEASRLMAQRFRDAMESEFAASEIGYGKFGDVDLDPERGIYRSAGRKRTPNGDRFYPFWSANWPGINTKIVIKPFPVKEYRGEENAKAAAIAARKAGLENYLDHLRRGLVPRMKSAAMPYTLFMPPTNLDIGLWRYMDFTKFVSMLQNDGLYFPTVAMLVDPFEGSYSRGNEEFRDRVYKHLPNRFHLTAGEMVKRLRGHVAVSCWHSNEQESAAMWKLYAQTPEAVCVQTTFRKLQAAMSGQARVGMVRYVDYEKGWIPESNPLAPFLYKRKSFEHEREVRAIVEPSEMEALLKIEGEPTTAPGRWVKINVAETIEQVLIAPDAPPWFLELVQQVTAKYERGAVPVMRSALAREPFY
jgi:hypothetical protein